LFSIDSLLDYSNSASVVRAYTIEGNAIINPVTFSEEIGEGDGPVGIAVSEDLGLDLGISSCYNKVILAKM